MSYFYRTPDFRVPRSLSPSGTEHHRALFLITWDEGCSVKTRNRGIAVKIGALSLILVLAGCSSAAQPDQTTSQADRLTPPPTQTHPGEHKRRLLITTDNPYMLPPDVLKKMETTGGSAY